MVFSNKSNIKIDNLFKPFGTEYFIKPKPNLDQNKKLKRFMKEK